MQRANEDRSSVALGWLLESKRLQELDDGSGDVVFAVFLEPHEPGPGSKPSFWDRLITFAVHNLQPSPVMDHVELVVPCRAGERAPVNFATYIGERSGWKVDRRENEKYYLRLHANRWRAVPVFGRQAARKVRATCNGSENIEYSLLRYVTAASCFRGIASMVPDLPRSPAHCATLVARVLKQSIGSIPRPSAWYGPASLFAELSEQLRRRGIAPMASELDIESLLRERRLLGGTDAEVRSMADAEALDAIRVLTLKVAAAAHQGDAVSQRMLQKQLANGLLRWSVHRVGG
tara:strand:+ start:4780 stop:5652 length:873 start_codon:yes stop_codon:yes gene_type:complete